MATKKSITKSRRKQSTSYTIAELEALTADLDQEMVADKFGPLTPADRRLWAKAKRKRGRPRVGGGAKVVSVSIEKSLLIRTDRLAKKLRVSRARLVSIGLEQVLGGPPPIAPLARNGYARGPRRAA